jgi:hypothetical protein
MMCMHDRHVGLPLPGCGHLAMQPAFLGAPSCLELHSSCLRSGMVCCGKEEVMLSEQVWLRTGVCCALPVVGPQSSYYYSKALLRMQLLTCAALCFEETLASAAESNNAACCYG